MTTLRDRLLDEIAKRLTEEDCGCGEPVEKFVDWNPDEHPRGPGGRFIRALSFGRDAITERLAPGRFGGGEGEGVAASVKGISPTLEAIITGKGVHPHTRRGRVKARLGKPIDCGDDVDKAARLLAAGHAVELRQPNTAATLLDKLSELSHEADKLGLTAPNYDLCKVSVKGSNLFCVKNKGIPRVQMPQLEGKPLPGSKADKLKRNSRGEVDLAPEFIRYLEDHGIKVFHTKERSENLRATQNQLNGPKVAGIMDAMRSGQKIEGKAWISRDNYIVDGHHRWAAAVALDAEDGKLDNSKMDVDRVDASIPVVLAYAKQFTREMGMPQEDVRDREHNPSDVDLPGLAKGSDMEKAVGHALDTIEASVGLPPGEGNAWGRLALIIARLRDFGWYGLFTVLDHTPAKLLESVQGMAEDDPDELQRRPVDIQEFLTMLYEHPADLLKVVQALGQIFKFDPGQPRAPNGRWTKTFLGSGIVGRYIAGMSGSLNRKLREGSSDPITAEEAVELDHVIERGPAVQGPLFRGLHRSHLPGLKPGAKYRDKGFSSTTGAVGVALGFGFGEPHERVLMAITVPDGTTAADVRSPLNEGEMILPRGGTYTITSVEENRPVFGASVTYVEAEWRPAPDPALVSAKGESGGIPTFDAEPAHTEISRDLKDLPIDVAPMGLDSTASVKDAKAWAAAVKTAFAKFPELGKPREIGWSGHKGIPFGDIEFASNPRSKWGQAVTNEIDEMGFEGTLVGAGTAPDDDGDGKIHTLINDSPETSDGIHAMLADSKAESSLATGTRSQEGQITHELGHALAWAAGVYGTDEKQRDSIWARLFAKHGLTIAAGTVSEYGHDSKTEAFAELFANYMSGNMNAETKANYEALLAEILGRPV